MVLMPECPNEEMKKTRQIDRAYISETYITSKRRKHKNILQEGFDKKLVYVNCLLNSV